MRKAIAMSSRHKQHERFDRTLASRAAGAAILHPASERSLKPESNAVIVSSKDCSVASFHRLAHVTAFS